MAALTTDRNTPSRLGDMREGPVAANVRIHKGAMLMRDVDGMLRPGATATGCVGVGRAEEGVDNTGGAAGDATIKWRAGVFLMANAEGDAVAAGDEDAACYIVDDQTVAASDGAGTRSKAGVVDEATSEGVWVRFDAALARAV
ncbi:hypothetical protein KUH32_14595 [Thalassococcus sp. CAU 1522]|uniref:DUF2190 domain-containing protein n=1 Tax=Thalassococcus arenae TaxID=2851652 RepID=A0ABS6NBE0_9RHOB|nr:hypothetical protein [Thalassococcus arenae]MBV2360992.1 hypothetical protein [Thalassococcus arenae]